MLNRLSGRANVQTVIDHQGLTEIVHPGTSASRHECASAFLWIDGRRDRWVPEWDIGLIPV